ncbi:MAG TPA: peptidase inhibitor family I36 protein, partial [Acidimicrobiales bacterium]|nr:peptidase inhibitor family I36 protein [Acidimicrobiales bacterium]
KLAALGVAGASLSIPASAAFAQEAPTTGGRPLTIDDIKSMKFISGQESDKKGQSGTLAETRPELPDGVVPPEYRSSKALAAAVTPCPDGKQCMWTGGYFAGPGRWLTGGHTGTYWNWAESKCTGSGNPDGNWKNCASSVRNDNGSYGFTLFNNSDTAPAGSYKNVPATEERDQLGTFNNNVERSVGVGV